MASVTVNLPEEVQRWVDTRVSEGGFRDERDYLTELVRRDREHEQKLARLREAIEQGRASPVVETSIEDIVARGRARVAAG